MNLEDLKNPELQEKLRSAKNAEELVALAKEKGLELTNDQLEGLSGGAGWINCHDALIDCSTLD